MYVGKREGLGKGRRESRFERKRERERVLRGVVNVKSDLLNFYF